MFKPLWQCPTRGLSKVFAAMFDELTKEDLDRIVFALSQYEHNPEFRDTLEKVLDLLVER